MKNNKTVTLLKVFLSVLMLVSFGCLAACGGNTALNVEFTEEDPVALINVEYDVGEILKKENGVEYSMTATYIYYDEETDEIEERELQCNGLKFIQHELFDVYVTVTAKKGSVTAEGEITVTLEISMDHLDARLRNGWSDETISMDINNKIDFIKDGTSSLKVTFRGAKYWDYDGVQWSWINGDGSFEGTVENHTFNKEDSFSSEVTDWSTASLVFWVYNPMDYDLEFFTRFMHVSSGVRHDMDWGSPSRAKYVKTVPAHEWKLVRFELADYGIYSEFKYEEGWGTAEGTTYYHPGILTDAVANKVRYTGVDREQMYTYYFYVDGLKFVDKAVADEMDPTYVPVPHDPYADATEVSAPLTYTAFDFIAENFKNSGKALSFDFRPFDDDVNTGNTVAFTLWTANWAPRITELVYIDMNGITAKDINGQDIGTITPLSDGWYNLKINCADMPLNVFEGATGGENAELIYFNIVEHAFYLNNVKFI